MITIENTGDRLLVSRHIDIIEVKVLEVSYSGKYAKIKYTVSDSTNWVAVDDYKILEVLPLDKYEPRKIKGPSSVKGTMQTIPAVLSILASQEGCDGEPYDQMIEAAEYIEYLEKIIKEGME
jgi:hypothetical protein